MSSAGPAQPPLPLGYVPRLGPADFILGDCNRIAAGWLANPAGWPMPRTVLVAPAGAGKSHLAGLFAASGGRVFDDADANADGEAMFHAWNAAAPPVPLLFTARRAPKFWGHGLADLASRLAATPLVRIDPPDDALVAAILEKRFADVGLRVPGDVIAYLVLRIERSFDGIAQIVARLDALSLAEHREITVPLARDLLEGQLQLL